mmetsp:Transcript_17807/g.33453  ORF Transcript_17807/g.33453 Transcript_17807/m.33453 type:complete len:356 (-) Transcript_17807:65-1132(-)
MGMLGTQESQGRSLQELGEMFLRTASDRTTGNDAFGFLNGLDLLLSELLALRIGCCLLVAGGLQVCRILLVGLLLRLRFIQVAFRGCFALQFLCLESALLLLLLLGLCHLGLQALHQQLVGMFFLLLLLLQADALVHELVLQTLEHGDDAPRLELVSLGSRSLCTFGCCALHEQALLTGQVSIDPTHCSAWHQLKVPSCRQLNKGGFLIFFLQSFQGTADGINGFAVILQRELKIRTGFLTAFRGVFLLRSCRLDIGRMLCDLLRQALCLGNCRLNVGLQGLDLVSCGADGAILLGKSHLAELLVLGELHLLLFHLRSAFGLHVLQHLDDLLHGRHIRRYGSRCQHEGKKALHYR